REMEGDLGALIASCGVVAATWQRMPDGEPNQLSPPLERLAALHSLAYGGGLDDEAALARLASTGVRAPGEAADLEPTRRPAPRAPASVLPGRISASGYNSLVACPYQFHARYVLGLAELDDVQEMIEKRDY